jgi:hypothetical protein
VPRHRGGRGTLSAACGRSQTDFVPPASSRLRSATKTPTQNPTATPTQACTGDCNNDRSVTIDELLTMVNIALGNAGAATCTAGDANHDGLVTIDEILAAVNNALNGCRNMATAGVTR